MTGPVCWFVRLWLGGTTCWWQTLVQRNTFECQRENCLCQVPGTYYPGSSISRICYSQSNKTPNPQEDGYYYICIWHL